MRKFLELFRKPTEDFKIHLMDVDNERILFSGIYGIGKTTFIKYFFKDETQSEILEAEKFRVFYLTPVNYSISSNEDIFNYLKSDIILELLSDPEFKVDNEYSTKDTLPLYFNTNLGSLFDLLKDTLPKIEKKTLGFSKKIVELIDGYSKYHKDINSVNEDQLQKFNLELIQKDGSIYEFNSVSEIITAMIYKLKQTHNTKTILIIDDLDRIDPSHIFRIFNVFASHFDYQSNDNKFGFDKIMFVCDIGNIRKIYHNIYGSDVDFNGYIDKFYSKNIFHFDIRSSLVGIINGVLSSIKYSDIPDTDIYIKSRILEGNQLRYTIQELILQGKLNLRSFFKFYEKAINYTNDDIRLLKSPHKIVEFPGIMQIKLLIEMYDDPETLIIALDYCRKNIPRNSDLENPELLSHIIYIIDVHQNRLNTGGNNYTFKDPDTNLIISYQLNNFDSYSYFAKDIKFIPSNDQKSENIYEFKNLLYFQILLIKQLRKVSYIK